MAPEAAALRRLAERLMDGDLVQPKEGELLLACLADAQQWERDGEWDKARQCRQEFLRRLEALEQTGVLAVPEGRAALTAARRLLDGYDVMSRNAA